MSERYEADAMQAVVDVLEQKPPVSVPDDFAARLMLRVPTARANRMPHLSPQNHGRRILYVAIVLSLIATLLVTPHAVGSWAWRSAQWTLMLQTAVLTLLSTRLARLRL